MRSSGRRLTMVAAFGAAALAMPASASAAACGDVLTSSTTLSSDINGCAGTALTVSGSHITLNLAGHRVDGTGSGTGILITGDDVSVINGSVREFATGVAVNSGADRVTVSGLRAFSNATGIDLNGGEQATISDNFVKLNSAAGIEAANARAVITRNQVTANDATGIDLHTGDAVQVTENTVSRNGISGIATSASNTNARILGNRVIANTSNGLNLGGTGGKAKGNDVEGNLNGVRVAGNNTTVKGNTLSSNEADGLIATAAVTGSLVTKNKAKRNGDDGIDLDGNGVTVSGNNASFNFDLGIEAEVGASDGGGNKAKGNRSPAGQCANVACSS